jgi:hypothetical protein
MRDQDLSSREPANPAEPGRGEPAFAADADRPVSTGRRQFLKKAALASAPVILTVASRPAWGHVCAPSGMCSGNASDATEGTDCMTGAGPNAWAATGVSNWPPPYNVNNIRFNDVFGAGPTQQLMQVLKGTGGGTYTPFHRAAVAALLNAANHTMDYLGPDPVAVVIGIVYDVLTTRFYVAAPGCSWDEFQTLDYFEMTFATT